MALQTLAKKAAPLIRRRRSSSAADLSDLEALAAGSHRGDIQDLIRDGIRGGLLRVVPVPGCFHRVRVIFNEFDKASKS